MASVPPATESSPATESLGRRPERAEGGEFQRQLAQSLFAISNDAVLVADASTGMLVEANDAAVRLLGKPREQIIGTHQTALHPPGELERYARIFREGVGQGRNITPELLVVHSSGALIPVEISSSVFEHDGQHLVMGVFRDVRERRRGVEFREQYTAMVAHDLANPLNALMLVGQALERRLARLQLPEEQQALGQLLGNARRMSSMIQDLYESIRLEAGKPALNLSKVRLSELCTQLVELMAPEERARVELQVPAVALESRGDGARLQRALQNLLANALMHTPHGSRVRVELTNGEREVTVVVSDQGPGIPAEHLPHLFERTFRVPGSGHEGLGLQSSQRTVHEIWVLKRSGRAAASPG